MSFGIPGPNLFSVSREGQSTIEEMERFSSKKRSSAGDHASERMKRRTGGALSEKTTSQLSARKSLTLKTHFMSLCIFHALYTSTIPLSDHDHDSCSEHYGRIRNSIKWMKNTFFSVSVSEHI